ncbi:MAG: hypothetical protein OEY56_00790 [Cyclobacteriaceae bacterium]|nr:hypothetical protein [Cyclobacteriaceae bacterium]
MKLKLSRKFLPLLIISLFMLSCGGTKTESANTQEASDEFDEAKSQVISQINDVIKDLPPPSEVPYLLMATGSDFDPSLVNGLEKADSYTNPSYKAAINLGIYTSDVGYLTSYEKAQETLNYIGVCQKLAESLGIASAMDLRLMGRFERNLSNKDSLKILVDEIILNTNDRLNALDRMNVAGFVLTGTYMEGLYLSNKLIETYPNDLPEESRNLILEPLIKIVIDQKPALDGLIVVLEGLAEDSDIAAVLADMKSLQTIYDSELTLVSEQISNNTGDMVLTADVLSSLNAQITKIRSKYIN